MCWFVFPGPQNSWYFFYEDDPRNSGKEAPEYLYSLQATITTQLFPSHGGKVIHMKLILHSPADVWLEIGHTQVQQQRMTNAWAWWKTRGSWEENDAGSSWVGIRGWTAWGRQESISNTTDKYSFSLGHKLMKPVRAARHVFWLPMPVGMLAKTEWYKHQGSRGFWLWL